MVARRVLGLAARQASNKTRGAIKKVAFDTSRSVTSMVRLRANGVHHLGIGDIR